jgi:RNA polymerase sigma factor (sigma-70 family)
MDLHAIAHTPLRVERGGCYGGSPRMTCSILLQPGGACRDLPAGERRNLGSLATVARPDFSTIKARRQPAWNSGNHAVIATTLRIMGDADNLKAGDRLMDVATGKGNVTLATPGHHTEGLPSGTANAAQRRLTAYFAVRPRRATQPASRSENWRRRSEKWRHLMAAAQSGESQAYETLLRELDAWLRRYYVRRLPAAAAEDARQDALLAVHAKRHTYAPSKPFGPWVAAIARYKWIDQVRDASRFAASSLHDEIPTEDRGEAAISAVVVDELLRRLKPAQARVIRLVKLDGASIEDASGATGQSTALVKVNIHRGLKKLAALAAGKAVTPTTAANSTMSRAASSHSNRSTAI